jgi:hypothetical protein
VGGETATMAKITRTVPMFNSQAQQAKLEFNVDQIRAGAIMLGIGGVIAFAGAAVAGLAVASAFQRRVQQMGVPPTELARQHWSAVKHATTTGVGVWLKEQPGVPLQPA